MKLIDVTEKIRKTMVKLQGLPESRKKIIMWSIVVILGVIMGYFWVKSFEKNFSEMKKIIESFVESTN